VARGGRSALDFGSKLRNQRKAREDPMPAATPVARPCLGSPESHGRDSTRVADRLNALRLTRQTVGDPEDIDQTGQVVTRGAQPAGADAGGKLLWVRRPLRATDWRA
jgi:hypothetical protein